MVKAEREGGGAATGGAAEVFATGITAGGCIEAFAAGITAGGCIEVFATGIAAGGCIEVFATGITAGGCLGVTAAGCFGVTGGAEAVATCVTAGCFAGGGVMCKALGVTTCFVATGRSAGACFRGGGVMCKTPGPEALGSTVWGGGASLDRGGDAFPSCFDIQISHMGICSTTSKDHSSSRPVSSRCAWANLGKKGWH